MTIELADDTSGRKTRGDARKRRRGKSECWDVDGQPRRLKIDQEGGERANQ